MTRTNTSGEQRRSELTELRRELREKQSYLNDDREELWADISRWLVKSYNAPVASLRTLVQSRLAELQENPQHKLYDHPGVDSGEEAFPEACKGCPHYGVQCPVLARHITKQTLERIFDETEDDVDLQGELSSYAAKHHCQVIQEAIEDWERGYAAFLSEGERLRTQLNADIKGIDLDSVGPGIEDALAESIGETSPSDAQNDAPTGGGPASETGLIDGLDDEGPPEEVAERVAAVTDSLMSEDEEGEA